MKSTFKRSMSLLLSLALAFSLMTVGASAEEFTDMPSGWSKEAVASAVENGLLRGNNGKLDPTGLLTRAQLATVIVRAFGADAEADLSGFTDVKADSWYYSALAKAKGMAVMNGTSDSTMSPDRPISRQEVFVLLARALKLADGNAETLNAYKDAESVGAWAVGGTAAMVSAGYVNGSDGYLLPTDNMTREQFAQILYNIFGTYYQAAGVYTDDVNGSLLVNVPDVIIRNAKITGDLVIGDGVGEGDLTLENVSIGGRLVVRGGVNSIHIKGSAISSVVIGKENGAVRVVADSSSHVEYINIADGKDDVIIEGKVDTIAVENEAVPVVLKNATVETLQVNGDNAEISLVGSTKVSTLDVAEDTKGVKIDKEESTAVGTLNTESDITITGEGEISNITGNGKPTDEKGEEVKPTTQPTKPTTPTGGNGGHSHSYASEWTTDETHHWHAATCSHTDLKDGYAEHDYTTVVSDTATCTDAGEKTEACVCGVSRTVASPAKDHDFTGAYLHDAAGHWHKCTRCDTTDTKNGHTWNHGEITTPAGCTSDGVKTYTCTACGETKTEPVSPNGHSYAETWSKNETHHWHATTCSHTDQKGSYAAHNYNETTGLCDCGARNPSVQASASFSLVDGQLYLNWQFTPAAASYKVYLGDSNGENWVLKTTTSRTSTALTFDFIEGGTYKVKVVDNSGTECIVGKTLTITRGTPKAGATVSFDGPDQNNRYTVNISGFSSNSGIGIHFYDSSKNSFYSDRLAADSNGSVVNGTIYYDISRAINGGFYSLEEFSSQAIDESGNASYTVSQCGADYISCGSAEEPQQVSAIKGLSLSNQNGQLKLTIEKPDSETGIKRYYIYLSQDSGNTWICSSGLINANNVNKDWTYLLGVELESGTYNKIKVVSTPETNSNYTANEYVADCSITVNVSQNSTSTATFTGPGDNGLYTVFIAGLSYSNEEHKWYGIAYVDNVASPTLQGGSCTYMNSANEEKTADANDYAGYYKIREYSVTFNETNATVEVKETAWQRCNSSNSNP